MFSWAPAFSRVSCCGFLFRFGPGGEDSISDDGMVGWVGWVGGRFTFMASNTEDTRHNLGTYTNNKYIERGPDGRLDGFV
jgi:hypothetical protein